jgi:hypothetical protein
MSLILIIGGLFLENFILVRNCTIFVSVKIYPAVCNYSYFKVNGGTFTFTREVPQFLRSSPRTFDRKSFDEKRRRRSKNKRDNLEDVHELKELTKMTRKEQLEVVVKR